MNIIYIYIEREREREKFLWFKPIRIGAENYSFEPTIWVVRWISEKEAIPCTFCLRFGCLQDVRSLSFLLGFLFLSGTCIHAMHMGCTPLGVCSYKILFTYQTKALIILSKTKSFFA